ncbi:zinc metalloproteinase nas-6-like [Centruroides sculpturatus]|uniref:zinc metalloproteinase nas-6-like n=1 Tax=Centruroides sculpturatus TaxID=218467 RepID=UPI000C6DEAA9|nr:zinc metalloproteinase nas-6-like [Centruroides sculpturatus]
MIFYIITLCLFLSYQKTVSVNNETVNYALYKSSMENVDLFEGDIRLDTSFGESRAVVLKQSELWDDGIIYYKFSPFLNYYRIKFLKSIFKYMEYVTCLRFVRRRRENNYIYIQEGKGCNSYVGKEGGRQILNLGSGCWNIGIILHELCHAIGLYHEHSRPDRDKYIKILWDNITDVAFNRHDGNPGISDTLVSPFICGMPVIPQKYDMKTKSHDTSQHSMENVDLFEGDIRLDTSFGESRAVVLKQSELWDDGIIYYKFSPFLNYYRIKFLKSIFKYMESVTCLRFVTRRRENNYIYIQGGKGCNSHVGKQGGRQILNLGRGCWNLGIIVHELGHVIGFYHEHNRPDRDRYIDIKWSNIIDEHTKTFLMYDKNLLRICDKYSYDSIMHYGPKEFAKDGKVSFEPTLPNITMKEITDRQFLSESDINCINKFYKCE